MWFIAALILASALSSEARTLRIPQDYPTIQSGIDSSVTGDTVLVALGIYFESVSINGTRHIVIKGDAVPDTGNYPRPIIDPSSLQNSRTLPCLRINGPSRLVIEDITFRNGPEMYPRQDLVIGGIRNSSTSDLTLRRCRFDSVFVGVGVSPGRLTLESCVFYKNNSVCAWVGWEGPGIIARDCDFSGRCTFQIESNDSTLIERCHFHENSLGPLLEIHGQGVIVRNCVFDQSANQNYHAFEAFNLQSAEIEDNLFADLSATTGAMYVRSNSSTDTIYIRRNHFLRCHSSTQNCNGLDLSHEHGDFRFSAVIRDNLFEACSGPISTAKALFLQTDARVVHNRFINMPTPVDHPAISLFRPIIALKDNFFYNTSFAVEMQGPDSVDAKYNWWGDSSGPYNAILNPNGQGDAVNNYVKAFPWYTDTSFFNLSSDEPRILHPSSFSLSVFPNPFNSTAKIKLQVKEPMIVKVELFDLLGRKVKELYNAPVAYEKEISFQVENLSSGVYFVRATDTIWNRPLAAQKLLLMK